MLAKEERNRKTKTNGKKNNCEECFSFFQTDEGMESDEQWSSSSSSSSPERYGDSLPARIGCLVLSVGYIGLAIFPFVNVVRMAILAARKRREERATLMPREYANESYSPVCYQLHTIVDSMLMETNTRNRHQRHGFAGSTFFCFSRQQHAQHTSFSRGWCHGNHQAKKTRGSCYGRRRFFGLRHRVCSAVTLSSWENGWAFFARFHHKATLQAHASQ